MDEETQKESDDKKTSGKNDTLTQNETKLINEEENKQNGKKLSVTGSDESTAKETGTENIATPVSNSTASNEEMSTGNWNLQLKTESSNSRVDEMAKETIVASVKRTTLRAYHEHEREDELLRLRFFVQFPVLLALSLCAYVGLVLQRSIGYLCSQSTSSKLVLISKLTKCVGKEMEEISLNTLQFWLQYWRRVSHTSGGPIAATFKLAAVFDSSHEKLD